MNSHFLFANDVVIHSFRVKFVFFEYVDPEALVVSEINHLGEN